ncbi:MAG: hypothetical protein COB42_06850 [Sulfurimonas sp.]|nr:MAG: hypothetical protein COB42_06850 [Sulfurimonas sp.]
MKTYFKQEENKGTQRQRCRACQRDDVKFSGARQVCNRCRNKKSRVVLPKWERDKPFKHTPVYTYGEAHILFKMNIELDNTNYKSLGISKHKPRMTKNEAGVYYTNKINREFERLGYGA